MIPFRSVRCTFAAVIILIVCVQWISSRVIYNGPGRLDMSLPYGHDQTEHTGSQNRALLSDRTHKHLRALKRPDPTIVESVRKRIKARMRGRHIDQSNERNLWTSHPKKADWSGPDTEEVYEVINSLL